MDAVINVEWRNQHSLQEFPFVGSSAYFPNGIFVDLAVAAYAAETVYLDSISIDEAQISGTLKTDTGETLSFSEAINDSSDASSEILASDGRSRGRVVFGLLAPSLIRSIGTKSMNFSVAVPVDPGCFIKLHEKQVASVEINGIKYRGIINFEAGDGVEIGGSGNEVSINATGKIVLDPCCQEYDPVKTISGVAPVMGGIIIKPKDSGQPHATYDNKQLIRITSIANGISISLSN